MVSGTIGQTLTHDGTDWAANSTLYNTNGQIGIGTTAPGSSAILDVQSTTKGFLLPSMTDIQRLAIAAPALGLLVFQNTAPVGFFYFDGSIWLQLGTSNTNSGDKTLIYTTNGF